MGVDRGAARRALAREAMQHLRDPLFRDGALVRNLDGGHTIIPALEDDTLGDVFSRLHLGSSGGPANLIVQMSDGVDYIALHPSERGAAALSDMDCPVTDGSHVGLLVALLREREGRPVVCRVVDPACQVELSPRGRGNTASALV